MSLPLSDRQSAFTKIEKLAAILQAHRALDTPRSTHWHEREREFVRRLAQAQIELERLEQRQRSEQRQAS